MADASGPRYYCPRCMDFHTHFMHPQVYEMTKHASVATSFGALQVPPDNPVFRCLYEPQAQIAAMDERGIDMNVISSCDVITSRSWAEPEAELHMSRLVNDMAADWVARYPQRFIGSFVAPLGDMNMALAELERSVRMGLRVINLPSNYRGAYLGEQRFVDLWAAIAGLGLVAFIHPDGVRDTWFQAYAMWNSIGQSIEEVKAMSSLIYEGVMDRHPKLKVVMAHGGGYMPHYMGRLDRNVSDKPYTARNLSKLPSEYLRDFYYDSCVYDVRTLELLIERVGADRVVVGGDYPVASQNPLDILNKLTGLSDADRHAIAVGNALHLLESGYEDLAARSQQVAQAVS
jgi:aminocarboxymuconate-semialdehyde decarboxylase